MTNSTGEGHENGGATDGSYFPDASEIDTIMTGGRINSGPGQLVFVPDGTVALGTLTAARTLQSPMTTHQPTGLCSQMLMSPKIGRAARVR